MPKKVLVLVGFFMTLMSQTNAVEREELIKKIEQIDRQYGDGSFEKMYLDCKANSMKLETNVHVDLESKKPVVGLDFEASTFTCAQILKVGGEWWEIRGKGQVDLHHIEASASLDDSGLNGEAGIYLGSASLETGAELGGVGASFGLEGNVGIGTSGGVNIKSTKDKTCVGGSFGASFGIGGKANFELCLKNAWNPLSSKFWS